MFNKMRGMAPPPGVHPVVSCATASVNDVDELPLHTEMLYEHNPCKQIDPDQPTTIEAPRMVYPYPPPLPRSTASHGSGSFLSDTHREPVEIAFPSTASDGT